MLYEKTYDWYNAVKIRRSYGRKLEISQCAVGLRKRFGSYIAVYDGKMRELLSPKCLDESELSDFLSEIEEPYSLVCEGVTLEKAIYPENCEKAMIAAVEAGASVARSGNEIEPLYIRKPQAERDLEKKNAEKSE